MSQKPPIYWVACAAALVVAMSTCGSSQTPAPVEVKLGPVRAQPQASVGTVCALVIAPDGTLWLWGMLGGTERPRQVDMNTDWAAAFTSGIDSFVWRKDGSLWEFGRYSFGATEPMLFFSGAPHAPPPLRPVLPGSKWTSVSEGNGHTLGIQIDGSLWGWGRNEYGQLGIPPQNSIWKPVRVGSDTNWVSVAAAEETSVGVKSDGTLWHWGVIGRAQPPPGQAWLSRITQPAPLQLGTNAEWQSAESTVFGVLCRRKDSSYWAIARSHTAHAANLIATNTTISLGVGKGIVRAAFAMDESYALKEDGTLWTWPFQPRPDTNSSSSCIVAWTFPTGLDTKPPALRRFGLRHDWVGIWSGGSTQVGVTADGNVWTWGTILGAPPRLPPHQGTQLDVVKAFLTRWFGFTFPSPTLFPTARSPWVIMRFVTNSPPESDGAHPPRKDAESRQPE